MSFGCLRVAAGGMWFLGWLILISVEEENTGPRECRCVTFLRCARDGLGKLGAILRLSLKEPLKREKEVFATLGAGRCDLKIVTPYSSSQKREERGRKKDKRKQTRSQFITAG
jgi:hypothetical protein